MVLEQGVKEEGVFHKRFWIADVLVCTGSKSPGNSCRLRRHVNGDVYDPEGLPTSRSTEAAKLPVTEASGLCGNETFPPQFRIHCLLLAEPSPSVRRLFPNTLLGKSPARHGEESATPKGENRVPEVPPCPQMVNSNEEVLSLKVEISVNQFNQRHQRSIQRIPSILLSAFYQIRCYLIYEIRFLASMSPSPTRFKIYMPEGISLGVQFTVLSRSSIVSNSCPLIL